MPNFIATDKQAKDIANNEHVTFIELLREQPPKGYDCSALVDNMVCFYQNLQIGNNGINIPLRYPAGKYIVKESWGILPWDSTQWPEDFEDLPPGVDRYYYKSLGDISPHGRWNSPASMPADAVRSELDLTVSVKRVQEVTIREQQYCGFHSSKDFQADFNVFHAKLRKTKDGKGYECFPYSDEYAKILEQDKRCELLADWYYWKGLPLTVNNNPFVVIMDGEVIKI